jgi:hypothetical protein
MDTTTDLVTLQELKKNQLALKSSIEWIKENLRIAPSDNFALIRSLYDDLVSAQTNLLTSKEEECEVLAKIMGKCVKAL